jgi:hypothetical protein
MDKLTQIIAYILDKYPHKMELSNARVTKMVYLSDWKSVLVRGCQISSIQWYFDNYGPFVWDISKAVEQDTTVFSIINDQTMFGARKMLFILKTKIDYNLLSDDDMKIINFVIDTTSKLNWNEFIKLVYSTFPIVSSERYSNLNLSQKAIEFESLKKHGASKK